MTDEKTLIKSSTMTLKDVPAISWQDDGISVPYDSFYNFAIKEGFKHVVTYPIGQKPQIAIASRTQEGLQKIVANIPRE